MAKTALQLSAPQRAACRPGEIPRRPGIQERLVRARATACEAAALLRERFGAKRVVAFGSLVRPGSFTPWSDIDLAASGIPAYQFFRAVGALSGLSKEFKLDLVDPEGCPAALHREIAREGEEL